MALDAESSHIGENSIVFMAGSSEVRCMLFVLILPTKHWVFDTQIQQRSFSNWSHVRNRALRRTVDDRHFQNMQDLKFSQ